MKYAILAHNGLCSQEKVELVIEIKTKPGSESNPLSLHVVWCSNCINISPSPHRLITNHCARSKVFKSTSTELPQINLTESAIYFRQINPTG